MNDLDFFFGLQAIPNQWLKIPELNSDDLYPLSFWEYEDLVTYYCQDRIEKYLDNSRGENNAIKIQTKKQST